MSKLIQLQVASKELGLPISLKGKNLTVKQLETAISKAKANQPQPEPIVPNPIPNQVVPKTQPVPVVPNPLPEPVPSEDDPIIPSPPNLDVKKDKEESLIQEIKEENENLLKIADFLKKDNKELSLKNEKLVEDNSVLKNNLESLSQEPIPTEEGSDIVQSRKENAALVSAKKEIKELKENSVSKSLFDETSKKLDEKQKENRKLIAEKLSLEKKIKELTPEENDMGEKKLD